MIDLQSITTPTFGPGGNGEWFKSEGGKATVQAPGWLKAKGLDAYEYEAGKGITAGEGVLSAIGAKAHEHGILMSLHAPYFISLSSVERKSATTASLTFKSPCGQPSFWVRTPSSFTAAARARSPARRR